MKGSEWVLKSIDNPIQGIINRSDERIKKQTIDGYKAEAVDAAKRGDADSIDICIEKLRDAGVENPEKAVMSSIASDV